MPSAIRDLRAAGMKLWMLTGDKPTTAMQIAVACSITAPLTASDVYDFNGCVGQRFASSTGYVRLVPLTRIADCPRTTVFVTTAASFSSATWSM